MKKNELLKTLWKKVSNLVNKCGETSSTARLEQIIKEMDLPNLYPYKPLPNVETFRISELSPHDPVLLRHGIVKRLKSAQYESTPYKNNIMNRYVKHQFKRLNQSRTNPRKFWRIARYLLFNSYSYKVICFNHVFPGWHRKYKYHVVKNILRSVFELNLKRYSYKIVKIPKADGTERPLGIPKPNWRIFLHGLNNILIIWLSPYISPEQHGFYPGRGTLTAWRSLLHKLEYRSILEFDMKKFFDSVNLHYLSSILKVMNVPEDLIILLLKWNQTMSSNSERHGITWSGPLEEASDYKYMLTGKPLNGFTDYEYWINRKRIDSVSRPELIPYEYYRGVSQGMPTSPLLSTLLLMPNLEQPNTDILLYADDGLIFSNENRVFKPVLGKETGMSFNEQKTYHIKENGKWQRNIKFLGLEYTPGCTNITTQVSQGTLKNSTRTPKTFTLDKLDAFIAAGYSLSYSGLPSETFDNWLDTKISGYLQSRLYDGTYDLGEIIQDFTYGYVDKSWSDLETQRLRVTPNYILNSEHNPPPMTIFNSSSFANYALSRWCRHHQKHGKSGNSLSW